MDIRNVFGSSTNDTPDRLGTRMHASGFRLVCCFVLSVFVGDAREARAQDASVGAIDELVRAPSMPSYEEYRLGQLHYLAGRSRTGVIVGASVTAVGIALVTPAFVNECIRVASSSSFDDLRCSTRGKALLGVGVPFLVSGVVTVLTTGIMLGVRRGRIRAIEDRIEYEKRRAFRYDPVSGAFAF